MQADLFATESPPNANPGANANANANAVAPLQAQVDALPAGWRELLQPCLGNAAWTAL